MFILAQGSLQRAYTANKGDTVSFNVEINQDNLFTREILHKEEITEERHLSHYVVVQLKSGYGIFLGDESIIEEVRMLCK